MAAFGKEQQPELFDLNPYRGEEERKAEEPTEAARQAAAFLTRINQLQMLDRREAVKVMDHMVRRQHGGE